MAQSISVRTIRFSARPTPADFAAASLALIALLMTLALAGTALARIGIGAYGATGDFLTFYSAGHLIWVGHGADLYDPATQESLQRSLYPAGFDNAIGYPLPVFASWIFAPFSALPFRLAFFLWIALNMLLLVILVRALSRHLAAVPALPRRLFLTVFALSMPAVTAITFGQVDLIVFASMLSAYMLLRDRRDALAGVALSVALFKPHFLVGIVLLLLISRRWRALAALTAVGVPLLIVPALITSPHLVVDNLALIASYPGADKRLAVNAGMMSNWRGFVVSVTHHHEIWLWLPGLAAIAVAALAIMLPAWRRYARGAVPLDQPYALAVMLPLLASPHLHTQSLVLMFIPLALYVRATFDRNGALVSPGAIVTKLLWLFTGLFALWFIEANGLALMVFLLLAVFWHIAFRWPDANSRLTLARDERRSAIGGPASIPVRDSIAP